MRLPPRHLSLSGLFKACANRRHLTFLSPRPPSKIPSCLLYAISFLRSRCQRGSRATDGTWVTVSLRLSFNCHYSLNLLFSLSWKNMTTTRSKFNVSSFSITASSSVHEPRATVISIPQDMKCIDSQLRKPIGTCRSEFRSPFAWCPLCIVSTV